MTTAPPLLAEAGSLSVLHRLNWGFVLACRATADIDPVACTALIDLAARPEGYRLGAMKSSYAFCDPTAAFQSQLENRELAFLVRDPSDRRALAFKATPKGMERSVQLDRALGTVLVTSFPGLTEEGLDRLVALCHDYARASGAPVAPDCLFPASALLCLAAYLRHLMLTASRFNMSSIQMVLLAEAARDPKSLGATVSDSRGAEEGLMQLQLDLLRDRGLLAAGDTCAVTEAGLARIAVFSQRLLAALTPSWERFSALEKASIGRLLQFVIYLFS